ncbi:MAG: helix-turn-helix transcriptional regulator [Roseburia sp.]|nr:helix-turn-helix transcriptional regulator [Roseburia sp.]
MEIVTYCYKVVKGKTFEIMEMAGLKLIRKKKNLNQLKVAYDLSISREALSHYENGKRSPNIEMLVAMSKYFNVSIDFLITGCEFQKR